jgi:hypothetical protein
LAGKLGFLVKNDKKSGFSFQSGPNPIKWGVGSKIAFDAMVEFLKSRICHLVEFPNKRVGYTRNTKR